MTPLAVSEKQFQASVVEYAKLAGWRVYHTRDSRGSEAGYPDLTLARNGTIVFAELKTEKGRLSRAQSEWLIALGGEPDGSIPPEVCAGILCGQLTILKWVRVWRPSDWAEIERVLR